MKSIQQHITERLQLNKDRVRHYEYFPKTKQELEDIVYKIAEEHKNDKIIDLNMIDTSEITDMEALFYNLKYNYNISEWNVSNVKNMSFMFSGSSFNNDISQWDVSNVRYMKEMFYYSRFNQDISKWNVSNVVNMSNMFRYSEFNNDISDWDISNVENMYRMFYNSKFKQDLTPWLDKLKYKHLVKEIINKVSAKTRIKRTFTRLKNYIKNNEND